MASWCDGMGSHGLHQNRGGDADECSLRERLEGLFQVCAKPDRAAAAFATARDWFRLA